MIRKNLRPLCSLTALLGTAALSQAAQFANFQVGSFNPSASPGYLATSKTESVALGTLGNFTTTITTTAPWDPSGPATGVAIPETWVEPAYSGQLSGLTVLGFLARANSSVAIQFNFASLTGGFLPAGSVIAYNDIDGLEQVTFSSSVPSWYSSAASPSNITGASTSAWNAILYFPLRMRPHPTIAPNPHDHHHDHLRRPQRPPLHDRLHLLGDYWHGSRRPSRHPALMVADERKISRNHHLRIIQG